MEALAALAPAVAEVDVLVDVRLIEVDHVMALIARAVQQCADFGDESLPLLRPSFPLANTIKWRNSGKNAQIRLENVAM